MSARPARTRAPLGGDSPHSSEGSRHAGLIGAFAGALVSLRGGRMIAIDLGVTQGEWRDFDPRAPLATV